MKKTLQINLLLILFILCTNLGYSQIRETEKAFFMGRTSQKYKSTRDYSLTIGYVTLEERDVYFEFSGGPSKFTLKETVPVKKGRGKFTIKLGGEELPAVGKGYKVLIGLRERGGDEKTTKSLTKINNIEIVSEDVPFSNNASFSVITPNKIEYDPNNDLNIDFNVDYSFSDDNQIQVTVWDGEVYISSSEITSLQAGTGTKELKVVFPKKIEGTNFKFILNFGTEQEFKTRTTKSEEILGITISKLLVFSTSELSKKSIQLSVDRNDPLLVLPGDPVYSYIKIINKNGKVVKEVTNTNKINIQDLNPENYYIVTNSGYYFKFIKSF